MDVLAKSVNEKLPQDYENIVFLTNHTDTIPISSILETVDVVCKELFMHQVNHRVY